MLAFYFKKKINYLIKTVKRKYIKKKKQFQFMKVVIAQYL